MDNSSSRKLQAIAIISAIAVSVVAASSLFALGGTPLNNNSIPQAFSQESAAVSGSMTITVTGDASTVLTPDQATIIVNMQTQPSDLSSVMQEQASKVEQVMSAVKDAAGDAQISIGQQNLYPYYSGSGVQPSNNVTFNVYASVAVHTNIDQLSTLVNKLAEEGFGFESVYVDPGYYASVMQGANIGEPAPSVDNTTDEEAQKNPITIGVTLNTKPDILTKAIDEYSGKYKNLLKVLDEVGVSEDQVQQNNFNIYPVFYGQSPTSDYNANTQVIVRTAPENIEKVTSAVLDVNSALVESVFMSVSDDAIDKARKDLSQQAIADARSRAEEMAQPLGLQVTGIKSIEAGNSQSPNPYGGDIVYRGVKVLQPYYYQNLSGNISVSVTVEFELGSAAE
ncbi:MAG TPA: SIMPL domain-containing protein [Nitrososphaera sp.]|jgi:uncharacterized protein YggE|nr:SIMPL domain-containing protein [Nitrososphaera sp.]HEX2615482.1 SIMPL domain-containing protein [Nitrososphaera sp.]